MIANVSPNSGSCEHTLNTLRYADRVKGVRVAECGVMATQRFDSRDAPAEIRKPGSAPSTGGSQPPQTNGPSQVDLPAKEQVAPLQLAALPAPAVQPVPVAVKEAQRAAPVPSARGGRYPGRRDGTGIPGAPTAAAASANPAPIAVAAPSNIDQQQAAPAAPIWQQAAQAAEHRLPLPAQDIQATWAGTPSPARSISGVLGQLRCWDGDGSIARADAGGLCAAAAAGDDVVGAIMVAEDDLITTHRQHIEECMATVREEMNLLANLDGSTGGGEHAACAGDCGEQVVSAACGQLPNAMPAHCRPGLQATLSATASTCQHCWHRSRRRCRSCSCASTASSSCCAAQCRASSESWTVACNRCQALLLCPGASSGAQQRFSFAW